MPKNPPTSADLKKRRRRLNALCAVLLLAGAGTGIFALSRILPAHGMWEYENRREYRELPELDAPCLLEIDVWYQGEAPQSVRVDREGIGLRKLSCTDDPEQKLLSIRCDIGKEDLADMPPDGAWLLSLVPMDNFELSYQVRLEPSREHIDADVSFARGPDGKRWISVRAGYQYLREDSAVRALAHLRGISYQPTVLDWTFDGSEGSVRICVDDVIEERGYRDKEASSCSVTVMCGGADGNGEPIAINEKSEMRLSDWPSYDEDAWNEMQDCPDGTEAFLDRLDPRRHDRPAEGASQGSQEGG